MMMDVCIYMYVYVYICADHAIEGLIQLAIYGMLRQSYDGRTDNHRRDQNPHHNTLL